MKWGKKGGGDAEPAVFAQLRPVSQFMESVYYPITFYSSGGNPERSMFYSCTQAGEKYIKQKIYLILNIFYFKIKK